jgi:hypothetical protein
MGKLSETRRIPKRKIFLNIKRISEEVKAPSLELSAEVKTVKKPIRV